MISVNIRSTTVALVTPNELRGRVNAVEMVFISASNELGAFESGAVAALVGTVTTVVAGGDRHDRDRARLDAGSSPSLARIGTARGPAARACRYARAMSVDRSTVWPYEDGEPGEFIYSRYAHPTGVEAERVLGELEGAPDGQALLFSSGSAATTALLLALLEPGQTVALAEGALLRHRRAHGRARPAGACAHVEFDQTGPPPDGVDLVWLEAPSNPFLTMPDLEAAAAHPAPVVVDSTAATPIHLRPLEHGADFVAAQRDEVPGRPLRRARRRGRLARRGRAPAAAAASAQRTGPDLRARRRRRSLRGLKTLRVRVERQTETARVLAERLRAHPGVETVRYPGFGGLLSFDVRGDAERSSARRG